MFLPLPLALAEDGAAILARVDAAASRGQDAHVVLAVQVTDRVGVTADRVLEIWQKGDDKRLVRFTEPARLAGTGLLVPDGHTVYLFLPAFGKPRRIVGDQRGDAFMGTDFSMEDLSRLSWADEYTATLEADEGDVLRLALAPKDSAAHRDATVRLWVREADSLVTKVEHVDAGGTVTRRLLLEDVRPVGSQPMAHHITVEYKHGAAGRGQLPCYGLRHRGFAGAG